jgi:hypothetical protein
MSDFKNPYTTHSATPPPRVKVDSPQLAAYSTGTFWRRVAAAFTSSRAYSLDQESHRVSAHRPAGDGEPYRNL